MVKMKIICIGKTNREFGAIIDDYIKRLPRDWRVDWQILPYSRKTAQAARQDESGNLLARLTSNDYVILLDERGEQLTSPKFSQKIERVLAQKTLVFVIGGAYGVNDELRARADFTLSFSPMVFPHQIARLVLVEQIYRAFAISRNLPYHHE